MEKLTNHPMNKKEAMSYVLKHRKGNISQLTEAIGEDRIREFEYLGYIRNGISKEGKTYKSTKNIEKDYDIFYGGTNCLNFIPNFLFGVLFKFHY